MINDNKKYFRYIKLLFFFALCFLNNRSLASINVPNGQIHPQKNRPNGIVRKRIIPARVTAGINALADNIVEIAAKGLNLKNKSDGIIGS